MTTFRSGFRKLAMAICGGALSVAFIGSPSASHAGDTLILATYNVQNYTLENRQLPGGGGFRPDYPKPESEKTALRAVIRSLNADVIALQEMGGLSFLEELRRDLATEGMDYPFGYAMLAADEKRGLAVISRIPLGKITAHRNLVGSAKPGANKAVPAEPVRRGLLEVQVPWHGGEFTLFVMHLKSRITDDKADPASEEQRAAEAVAVRDQILRGLPTDPHSNQISESARFVVAGDFNDVPGSRPLRAVQSKGKRTIATWIDASDSRGHRWTHAYAKQAVYSRFDHVLVSPALESSVEKSWIYDAPETAIASDHRPVVLQLRSPSVAETEAQKSGAR